MNKNINAEVIDEELQHLRALLFKDPSSDRRPQETQQQRIQVFCRFRDFLPFESVDRNHPCWSLKNASVSFCGGVANAVARGSSSYFFDHVFGPEVSQRDVYKQVAPLVQDVLNGERRAVICYGQTSSGKTFTMEGGSGEQQGLIPRVLCGLFGSSDDIIDVAVSCRKHDSQQMFISMFEIHTEVLHDLLNPDGCAELVIGPDRKGEVIVHGLTEVFVQTLPEALALVKHGQRHRATASNGINQQSSRSHSILQVRFRNSSNHSYKGQSLQYGKLFLVDLAGSECAKRACLLSDGGTSVGKIATTNQLRSINQSLLALRIVISSLASCRRASANRHVPYRSSKLTHVLQDALSGDSKTILVLNCSPSLELAAETASTLRFGTCARKVACCTRRGGHTKLRAHQLLLILQEARREIELLRGLSNQPPQIDVLPSPLFTPRRNQTGLDANLLSSEKAPSKARFEVDAAATSILSRKSVKGISPAPSLLSLGDVRRTDIEGCSLPSSARWSTHGQSDAPAPSPISTPRLNRTGLDVNIFSCEKAPRQARFEVDAASTSILSRQSMKAISPAPSLLSLGDVRRTDIEGCSLPSSARWSTRGISDASAPSQSSTPRLNRIGLDVNLFSCEKPPRQARFEVDATASSILSTQSVKDISLVPSFLSLGDVRRTDMEGSSLPSSARWLYDRFCTTEECCHLAACGRLEETSFQFPQSSMPIITRGRQLARSPAARHRPGLVCRNTSFASSSVGSCPQSLLQKSVFAPLSLSCCSDTSMSSLMSLMEADPLDIADTIAQTKGSTNLEMRPLINESSLVHERMLRAAFDLNAVERNLDAFPDEDEDDLFESHEIEEICMLHDQNVQEYFDSRALFNEEDVQLENGRNRLLEESVGADNRTELGIFAAVDGGGVNAEDPRLVVENRVASRCLTLTLSQVVLTYTYMKVALASEPHPEGVRASAQDSLLEKLDMSMGRSSTDSCVTDKVDIEADSAIDLDVVALVQGVLAHTYSKIAGIDVYGAGIGENNEFAMKVSRFDGEFEAAIEDQPIGSRAQAEILLAYMYSKAAKVRTSPSSEKKVALLGARIVSASGAEDKHKLEVLGLTTIGAYFSSAPAGVRLVLIIVKVIALSVFLLLLAVEVAWRIGPPPEDFM